MSNPIYQDATMAQVRAVDGTYISYPFLEDGDTQTKVYNMVCTQTAADYNAAQIALDTPMSSAAAAGVIALPFPADSTAYFVGDTGMQPAGGGMISFTRTFANIPQTVTIPSGTEAYQFPGILQGNLTITEIELDNINAADTDVFITTSAPHGITAGDNVEIRSIVADDSAGDRFQLKIWIDEGFNTEPGGWQQVPVAEIISSTKFRLDDPSTLLHGPAQAEGVCQQVLSGEVRVADAQNYTITNASMNVSGPGVLFTTSAVHSLATGQEIAIDANFAIGTSDFYHTVTGRYIVTSIPDNRTFTVDVGIKFEQFEALNLNGNGKATSVGYEREANSLYAPTFTRYEYFLPGISSNINTAQDIQTQNQFQVIDTQTGKVTDKTRNQFVDRREYPGLVLFDVVYPTRPDCSSYINMIGSGAQLVISSNVQKWAGNIYVKKTKTVKAQ